MSRWSYDKDCPGCRPVAIDLQTGKVCGPDHPLAKAMGELWENTGPMVKAAFHRVTCQSSRDMLDLALANKFMAELKDRADEV